MSDIASRTMLPGRRSSWTIKASVGEQTFYLTFGEYDDGRLGEVWIDASKEGTFVRGVLGALARTISVALQCGTPVSEIVKALRSLNFPPNGAVAGSASVSSATSVADWIAAEIEAAYGEPDR